MFINNQDNLKKEISYNHLIQTLKVNDFNYVENDSQKKYIDYKIESNNCVEDAIQNIFPSLNENDLNTEYLNDKRIYEIITNNTEIKTKSLNIKKKNKISDKHIKEKIFRIKKIRNILGRRKLNQPQLYSYGANHTKFGEDNIVRKIKIYFTNSTMKYINKKYIEFLGKKSKKRLLGRIKPNFTIVWTKKENQEYLAKKIRDIFSEKLSTKCRRFPNNYNQKQIAKILENGKAKEVINILNTSVQDMFEKYISQDNIIQGYNLKYDLEEIEKRNGKNYAIIYKSIALNLIEILNKKGRKD